MPEPLHQADLDGPRADLACELIRTGEAPVRIGDVQIGRDVHGPAATGRVQVEILTSSAVVPAEPTRTELVRSARVTAGALLADPRVAAVVAEHGSDWSLVHDDGHTRVRLAPLDAPAGPAGPAGPTSGRRHPAS